MPTFDLSWSLSGSATLEADDIEEATQILQDGLLDLDSSMLESIDVDEVTVDDHQDPDD